MTHEGEGSWSTTLKGRIEVRSLNSSEKRVWRIDSLGKKEEPYAKGTWRTWGLRSYLWWCRPDRCLGVPSTNCVVGACWARWTAGSVLLRYQSHEFSDISLRNYCQSALIAHQRSDDKADDARYYLKGALCVNMDRRADEFSRIPCTSRVSSKAHGSLTILFVVYDEFRLRAYLFMVVEL